METFRSRILWSVPASMIIALWAIGVLGAAATSFPVPYTFPEALGKIAHGGWRMFWPGEFGECRGWHRLIFWPLQVSPLTAAALWCPCLVPWRTRARRITALAAALLVPGWFVVLMPWADIAWSNAWSCLFGVGYGEDWQDGDVAFIAAILWWCLLLPNVFIAAMRRVPVPGEARCLACGYSTIGLPTAICPECGNAGSPPARG